MHLKLLIFVILITSVLVQILPGQNAQEVLTNAKIIELVKMRLGEPLIVSKINHSVCKCDTSIASIGKLKVAKVSDTIIMAMMESSNGPAETAKPKFEDKVISIPTKPHSKPNTETAADAGPNVLNKIKEPGIYLFEEGENVSDRTKRF